MTEPTRTSTSTPATTRAATANARSGASLNARQDTLSAMASPTTKTPGPSAESGWPQQKTWLSPKPATGIKVVSSAFLPDILVASVALLSTSNLTSH